MYSDDQVAQKVIKKQKKKLHLGVCDVPPSVFRFWLENCKDKNKKKYNCYYFGAEKKT